ncbi:hypothetical protein [Chitinolyticbacter albus]|uniref:hypothetical protein n=1 Tax=Chitinolyticbacter albus TaxID=2961951 RepID=UPI00210C5437|nr:hypothetical protein [Chitinolyticbacter albus]
MPGPVCLIAPEGLSARLQSRLAQAGCAADWLGAAPPAAVPQNALQLSVVGTSTAITSLDSVEIAVVLDHPLAEHLGWMLAVSGNANALRQAARWLDALAPVPRGWLHVGSAGAAAFVGGINALWAEQQQRIIAWLAERGPRGAAHFDPASWQLLAQQTQSELHALARRYLAGNPAPDEIATRLARAIAMLYPGT